MGRIKFLFAMFIRKILPINKKRIVFTSYAGHFSDSPKYVFEKMIMLRPDLDYVWLVNKKYMSNVIDNTCNNCNFRIVNYDSLKAAFYYGTAQIVVDNVHSFKAVYLNNNSFFGKVRYKLLCKMCYKRNQFLYSTWHGTPLKKIGGDQVKSNTFDNYCPNTTFLLGDKFVLEILDRMHFHKVPCKLIGCARNDLLHCNENEVAKIKKKLGLPLNKKIVLFAPTFRTGSSEKDKDIARSGINQLNEIDFKKLFATLKSKFGSDWVFVGRFHYHVERLVDWDSLKKQYGDSVINGNANDDMAEYLACTDLLITDVSSCMYDFMITKKPILLFFPDYEYYLTVERGLYYPMDKLPFPFSTDFDGLINNINSFNNKSYKENVNKLIKEFGVVSDANASEKIAKYILKDRGLL